MNDAQWSLLVGVLVAVIMRTLDSFLPKGYMLKVMKKWLVKRDDEEEEE